MHYLFSGRTKYLIVFAAVAFFGFAPFFQSNVARAEGSRDLTDGDGYRPYLLYADSATGSIIDRTVFKTFAQPGETIHMGSSANGIGEGVIRYRSPVSAAWTQCVIGGGVGVINNRAQENVGPFPALGGYTPCSVTVGAGELGVWEVEFTSPNPAQRGNATGNPLNPQPAPVGDNWTLTNPAAQPAGVRWIRAWDVTVTNAGGTMELGRVYADYMPLNMGNNIPGEQVFSSEVYVFTEDGYGYVVDMNGIDAFGFQFLSNNKGLRDTSGKPIYRSIQFFGPNNNQQVPSGYSVKDPSVPDDPANNDFTHKLFFNEPDFDVLDPLPGDIAPSASGNVVFQTPPIPPPSVTNFQFVGQEGTPDAAGTNPLTGTFSFESSAAGTFQIVLDTNRNGTFGDYPDTVLTDYAQPGLNEVTWDGVDQAGQPVPAGNVGYDAQIRLFGGEVHFPFFDPENSYFGIKITRVLDPGTTLPEPAVDTVYYNDRYTYRGDVAYDYSLCSGTGDTPPPPVESDIYYPDGCYGIPPNPRAADNGISSAGGAHIWEEDFGNRRGMDTWANYPSPPESRIDIVTLRQADLAIDKSHVQEQLSAGGPITFLLNVTNQFGPSDAYASTVSDDLPDVFQNVSWTCEGVNGGACSVASGVGDITNVVVDLPVGSSVLFTINATIDPTLPVGMEITNRAVVLRPNDVTDPNDVDRQGAGNNSDTDSIILVPGGTATPTPTLTSTPSSTPSETPVVTVPPDVTVTGTPPECPVEECQLTATSTPTPTATIAGTPTATPGVPYLFKSANPPFARPDEEVTWTITVVNPQASPINNVNVTDNIPAGMEVISATASSGIVTVNGQSISFFLAQLAGNTEVTITIRVRLLASASGGCSSTTYRNLATLTADSITPQQASATVRCLTGLPDTGESMWSELRIVIFGAAGLAGAGILLFVLKRLARA
jgi:uncharacterized repeat protein (TIGR01451 family)